MVRLDKGQRHRVEYRNVKYLSPGTGWYLQKYEDGRAQTLSIKQLHASVNLWKDDTEHEIPQQVMDELQNPTYEVVL